MDKFETVWKKIDAVLFQLLRPTEARISIAPFSSATVPSAARSPQ